MKLRTFTFAAIVVLALSLVVVGAWAEVQMMPRIVPLPVQALHEGPAPTLSQAQLDALLARVAHNLDPAVRSRLAEAVLNESARAGYDPLFVLALVSVESGFRVSVSSERGAAGLMQLKPSTFAWIAAREPDIGGDDGAVAEDPVVDVRLAIRYFHWLEKRFHSRDEALMAYNAGPRRIAEYKQDEGIPDRLREYPRRVLREYQRFVRMQAGEAAAGPMLARKD